MTITRLSETLSFNDDDKQIIATMKKVGAWEKMKPESLTAGKDRTMICNNYIFQWYDNPKDSGYVSFHSTNPVELFEIYLKINSKQQESKT